MKEYSVDRQKLFIVLDYSDGGDLEDFLKKHPSLSDKQKLILVYQMAKGIKYFHSKGVIHRDLKPKNIFLQDRTIKIGDFGLARHSGNNQAIKADTTQIYTLVYAAPEFIRGEDQT